MIMDGNHSDKKKTNQNIFFYIGIIWIGLALFGLIFDPEKKLIIASQIVVGLVSFILYFISIRKS